MNKVNDELVQEFKNDFKAAVTELEVKYGASINLGPVKMGSRSFRGKLTIQPPQSVFVPANASELAVGDKVNINHKKLKGVVFTITKLNKLKARMDDGIGGKDMSVAYNMIRKETWD